MRGVDWVWELPAAVWVSPVGREGARWHGVGQHYTQWRLGGGRTGLSLGASSGQVPEPRLPCGCALAWRRPALRSVRVGRRSDGFDLGGSSGRVGEPRRPCGCAFAWRRPDLRSVRVGGCGEWFEFGSFQRPWCLTASAVWVRVCMA